MRPFGLFPFSTIPLNGSGKLFGRGLGVIHCLLVDTGDGLILVDSGYGTQDYNNPTPLVSAFNKAIGLVNDPNECAVKQVVALGYQPEDVQDIFLTHMHLDHSGGLPDFPHARVHVYEAEYKKALHSTGIESYVYIDQHWAHVPDWQVHRLEGDTWRGLDCTPTVRINGVEVFLVPMPGHSVGHSAIVVHLLSEDRWLIHAGDGYGFHGQIDPVRPHYPPFHWLFRPLFFSHRVTRSMFKYDAQFIRLRKELGGRIEIFCAHNPFEYERLAGENITQTSS
jgi:glyoxylase-like metal-dependent hydrolase (beta-lactamase superfamily II)